MLRNRKGNQDNITSTDSSDSCTSKTKKKDEDVKPSKVKVWILACRPHTLTASIVPVLVSSALIAHHISLSSPSDSNSSISTNSFYHLSFVFASFACLIQLGTNLHNDYSDFIKGADTDSRVGQARATQKGWLSPKETAMGSTLCVGLATLLGLYLTFLASSPSPPSSSVIDYYMIFVTISSAFNAFCYTGGEYPLGYIGLGHLSIGYSGLGDLFAFLYFGIVATITVPYLFLVQDRQQKIMHYRQEQNLQLNGGGDFVSIWKSSLMYKSFAIALPIGFFATAIIVVNNLRDRETDVVVGKNTMAVRIGEKCTRFEYILLVIGSYVLLAPLSYMLMDADGSNNSEIDNRRGSLWLFLPLLSLPVAWKELKAVGFGGKDGGALNSHVGGTAKLQLVYSLLFIAGMYMSLL